MGNIYNIPAEYPFLDTLAAGLLTEVGSETEKLIDIKILLPTRRACRTLRSSFLRLTKGQALLLPSMQAVGDLDVEELDIMLTGLNNGQNPSLDVPPVLSPLRRHLLLAAQIQKIPHFTGSIAQSIKLAIALGRLMDQIYNEDLCLTNLDKLVPEDFATHWQITIKFLEILSQTWPTILETHGVIDAADRRNRILIAQCKLWTQSQPTQRIIAAGITGTVPTVASLMKIVRNLPQGEVILPAYDNNLDEESWNHISESHPQFALQQLLLQLEHSPLEIENWPLIPTTPSNDTIAKSMLATEIMRPPATTQQWQQLEQSEKSQPLKQLLNGNSLHRIDCASPQEEALLIATLMRETIEDPEKICTLVTPDRHLARRVSSALERWNVKVDDSGGFNLAHSRVGAYLLLSMKACVDGLSPISLLSLLSHNLTTGGGNDSFRSHARLLEKRILRGPKPDKPNFEGLRLRIKQKQVAEYDPLNEVDTVHIEALLQNLEPIFTPILDEAELRKPLKHWLERHITLAETLCSRTDQHGSEILWQGDEGETAATFLAELYEQATHLAHMTIEEYYELLEHLMKGQMVRPEFGTHPRLNILGLMEARLYQADRIIIAGLNEATWPPETPADMWMSRPMRIEYGLPDQERVIGQAAHDFTSLLCAPDVFMTRSKKMDNSPTVPARWLQRLDTIIASLGLDKDILDNDQYRFMIDGLLHSNIEPKPCGRPAPRPPLHTRPQKLSVTQIEKWMMDPYTIYASHILKLKKLPPLEENVDAAQKGSITHKVLENFIESYKTDLPENAQSILLNMAKDELGIKQEDPAMENFWWPRFVRIADWFIDNEQQWRKTSKPHATEVRGELTLPTNQNQFTLTARADRIDQRVDKSYAIIDYKTGMPPTERQIISGLKPQLSLEAAILLKAGYEHTIAGDVTYVGAWKLTGGYPQAERKDYFRSKSSQPIETIAEDAIEGLTNVINIFNDEQTPYLSFPKMPKDIPLSCQDYVHLARVKEWAETSESDGGTS